MTSSQLLLFGSAPVQDEPDYPAAPFRPESSSSRAGAALIEHDDQRVTLRAWIVWLLELAGPVSADGSTGGMTVEELTDAVERYRGQKTKETTIIGRVGGRRPELGRWVVKSGKRRRSKAGVEVDVYVHRDHDESEFSA